MRQEQGERELQGEASPSSVKRNEKKTGRQGREEGKGHRAGSQKTALLLTTKGK